MESAGLSTWEILFARAMRLIDSAREFGLPTDDWTFGGGTVLMRRHRHRLSKDVDIFINDPQFIGYLTPRLSQTAEDLTHDYVEDTRFVKLVFPEGEIDFVAVPPLTQTPAQEETILGRRILVETSAEIVAKKVWYRGADFTARDMFDLSMVAEREPRALRGILRILRDRRGMILDRMEKREAELRQDFAGLKTLDYRPGFDDCEQRITRILLRAA